MSSVKREAGLEPFPGVILRAFQPDDVKPLQALTQRALGEDYPLSLFLDIHSWWPDGFIVAQGEEGVVGFLAGIVSAPGKARVLMLAVTEGRRGSGIGSALMEEFEGRCRERGLRSIELEVRESNDGALRFYERLGYSVKSFLPRFYTDGEDGYKMAKALER